ncbi:MAG: RDD family protein [Thermodesulfobacteriota bacterium]|nr:RDD family protein [Thermodesulfobacteriota bacterium]
MERATPNDRILAFLIDDVIFVVIGFITFAFIRPTFGAISGLDIILVIVLNVVFFLKDATGQSPGKHVMKIKIVEKASLGRPKPFVIFVRNFLLCLWIIEAPLMLIDKNKEPSGTRVKRSPAGRG